MKLRNHILKRNSYKVNIPKHLLQSIRVHQAIMEAGIKISIDEDQLETFKYVNKYFPTLYSVDSNGNVLDVRISHKKPVVEFSGVQQPLVFPNSIINLCKSMWSSDRKIKFHFKGLLTEDRETVIKDWAKRHNVDIDEIVVKNSAIGRNFPEKAWDNDYYREISISQFVLCPNGDFVWTYRFFEATLCGAIPIVQDSCSLYDGYKFFYMKDKEYLWRQSDAEHNFNRTLELMAPPKNLKELLIREAGN